MAFELIFDDDNYLESFRVSGWHLEVLDNASPFLGYSNGIEMAEELLEDFDFHEGLSWEGAARKIVLVALAVFN